MNEPRAIDWRQVKALLRAYIVMSVRAMPIRAGARGGQKSSGGLRGLWIVLGIYTMIGAFLSMFAGMTERIFDYSFMLHMMTLFVVGSAAMNEASEVLFSTKENDVLLFRPIHPSTLILAKTATIVGFTGLLAIAINLFPTFAMLAVDDAQPWVPLAHILSVSVSTIFASATVVCCYGAVAKMLGRERFQRVITAAQIASTMFLAVGFQVVPRMLDKFKLWDTAREPGLIWIAPPTWFAALDAYLGANSAMGLLVWPATAGLAITAVLAWLGVLRLPTAAGSVASLPEEPRPEIKPVTVREARGGGVIGKLLDVWMRDPVERASFRLASAYILRERSIKVRLAAALSFYVVFPFLTIFRNHGGEAGPKAAMDIMPLFIVWMTAIVPFTVLEALRISSHPSAADVFAVTPIRDPSKIFHGVRKAAMVFVQWPLLVYSLLFGAWAMREHLDSMWLAASAVIAMPTLSLLSGLVGGYLPLSVPQRTGQRTLQTMIVFLGMGVASGIGVLTYFAWKFGYLWPFLATEVVVLVVAHVAIVRWIACRELGRGRETWAASTSA